MCYLPFLCIICDSSIFYVEIVSKYCISLEKKKVYFSLRNFTLFVKFTSKFWVKMSLNKSVENLNTWHSG